ncbi:MAG: universal stress protein [Chloroflexi bacterium]|nr:universal stress protein [Chloroflexota bacterium]
MSRKPKQRSNRATGDASNSPSAKHPSRVIVPLDGSAHAMVSLPIAKELAKLERATLHIVHVAEPVLLPQEVLHKLGLTSEQLRGSVIEEITGTPAEAITRLARDWQSRLIVMCTHTGVLEPRGELGPVAEDVLKLAPCPVVLVRPERGLRSWTLQHMLLPHDGTPSTAVAIGPAADLAHKAGAELVVLHVAVPGARRPVEPGTFATPRYVDQPQHEWPAWTREFLERLRVLGHAPGEIRLRLLLGKGEPGDEIVQTAGKQNSDLIILGWHGRLEAERAATMKKVISSSPCPVFITRVVGQ